MLLVEYRGYIAGVLTTVCYIPQVIPVFKPRDARGISLLFIILLLIGVLAWLLYGILLALFPMILWNSIGLVIVATLIYG